MAQIFLSYSSADRIRAEVLKDWFESLGWSVFWDREIPPGENWESYLLAHLDQAACVVVLWTPAASESDWVINEATAALERGRLVQIKATGLSAPPPFDAIQALPFQAWAAEEDHPQMARLIQEVARRLGGAPPRSNPVTPKAARPNADRYEVASAVFHYCAAMTTFRLRQIAGTPQSAAALAGACQELERVLMPIAHEDLHDMIRHFDDALFLRQNPSGPDQAGAPGAAANRLPTMPAICQAAPMTAIESTVSGRRDLKVMGLIGTAHFFSHFYILVLPPLFPLLRDEYGVGYAALGLALAVLNGVTGLIQAPVGFLVDRFGARALLIAGLGLFSVAIGLVGVFPTYPMLLALMVLGGLGNSVFHPADYAILSSAVDQRRMGRAFSIHTFGGFAGFALAPAVIVFLTAMFDWRIALMISGGAGLAVTLLMLVNSGVLRTDADDERLAARSTGGGGAGVRLLLSVPILMALLFFTMLSLSQGGFMSFSVAAIEALYRVPLAEATVPLTVYLAASAAGVLAGGWVADRTQQHHHVVGVSFLLVAVFSALIPKLLPPLAVTAGLFALAGLFSGVVAPSRDMMVRAVTPPGASGKVFGFVTTGFNIGGIGGPLLFGFVLDYADPGLVFWTIAALSLLTLGVVYGTPRVGPQEGAAPAHH